MEQAGMGVGVGDYDLDGHLDLFKARCGWRNILYHNDGREISRTLPAPHALSGNALRLLGAGIVIRQRRSARPLHVTGHVYPEAERILPQYLNKRRVPSLETWVKVFSKNSSSRRVRA
jgi:hypothetical protein